MIPALAANNAAAEGLKMVDLRVPSIGPAKQVLFVLWHIPDGAQVNEGQPLVELETEKASVSVPSPASGVLRQIAAPGRPVLVGQVLGRIETT